MQINLPEEQQKVASIFFPNAWSRTLAAAKSDQRFVHYTSAEVAMRILQNNEVWLRKATCMNDFLEIEHGFECLNHAYKARNERFKRIFDELFVGFSEKLEANFNAWLPHFRTDTYITCLSEHNADEDQIGRLSMWRAYGGESGVAMVLNPTVFLDASDALGAYTSPVEYLTKNQFLTRLDDFLDGISKQSDLLRLLGAESVLLWMTEVFRSAILCTKHPGFREEAEWRVIYSPKYRASSRIKNEIETIRGIPQPVCKIRLENIPEENFIGAAIPDLLDRIIIGPARHPDVLLEAFIALLSAAGVGDAASRVYVSDIPLRR